MNKTRTILRVDASMRREGSVTRDLTDRLVAQFPGATIISRDLASEPLPQIDETWIGANFTKAPERDDRQVARMRQSDELVSELEAADTIVIGLPVYNFGIPAALKAWIDLVGRAGVTFRYTAQGPEGLLKGKKAVILAASGGVPAGSPADFATPYLKHVLGFLGITDVEVIAADSLNMKDDSLKAAQDRIERCAAA